MEEVKRTDLIDIMGGCEAIKPAVLHGLRLFEDNAELLSRWKELYSDWKCTYPYMDVDAEIRAAHTHLMSMKPAKRWKDRGRYLGAWVRRVEQYRKPKMTTAEALLQGMPR